MMDTDETPLIPLRMDSFFGEVKEDSIMDDSMNTKTRSVIKKEENYFRLPTLPEKLEIIHEWFGQAARRQYQKEQLAKGQKVEDDSFTPEFIDIDSAAEYLVEKQLITDQDAGLK